MTQLALVAAWGLVSVPVLASGQVDVGLKVLDVISGVGLAAFLLRALLARSLRTAGEFEEMRALLVEANDRTEIERQRADKEAAARQRIQDAVLTDLTPALMRNAAQGERMVESAARSSELMEKLIDAFLGRIKE